MNSRDERARCRPAEKRDGRSSTEARAKCLETRRPKPIKELREGLVKLGVAFQHVQERRPDLVHVGRLLEFSARYLKEAPLGEDVAERLNRLVLALLFIGYPVGHPTRWCDVYEVSEEGLQQLAADVKLRHAAAQESRPRSDGTINFLEARNAILLRRKDPTKPRGL